MVAKQTNNQAGLNQKQLAALKPGHFKRKEEIMRKSELKIITNSKKLASYIILITESSPKKYRYLYIDKMHECILFIIEYLYKANDTILGDKQRLIYQENVKSKLKLLDAISNLSYEAKCITFNSLEQLQKEVNRSKQGCTITS